MTIDGLPATEWLTQAIRECPSTDPNFLDGWLTAALDDAVEQVGWVDRYGGIHPLVPIPGRDRMRQPTDRPLFAFKEPSSGGNMVTPSDNMMPVVWQVWQQTDMTEGRGGMSPTRDEVYATEQDAWDSINHLGGVFGRFPGRNCYPMNDLIGCTSWQEAKARLGHAIDYDVRPLVVQSDDALYDRKISQ